MANSTEIIWETLLETLGKKHSGIGKKTRTADVFQSHEEVFEFVSRLHVTLEKTFGKSVEKEFDEVSVRYIFQTFGNIWAYFSLRLDGSPAPNGKKNEKTLLL